MSKKREKMTESKAYSKIATRAIKWRGIIINETIYLERLIDEYLCRYFCPDEKKRTDLLQLLMATERITLFNKIGLLKYLMERDNKPFCAKNKGIFTDLQTIAEERNLFAHNLLDTSLNGYKAYKKGKIIIIKFKNDVKPIEYDIYKIEKTVKQILKYVDVMQDLMINS